MGFTAGAFGVWFFCGALLVFFGTGFFRGFAVRFFRCGFLDAEDLVAAFLVGGRRFFRTVCFFVGFFFVGFFFVDCFFAGRFLDGAGFFFFCVAVGLDWVDRVCPGRPLKPRMQSAMSIRWKISFKTQVKDLFIEFTKKHGERKEKSGVFFCLYRNLYNTQSTKFPLMVSKATP